MLDLTLDTLEYATQLEEAGVDRKQARAQAEALRRVEERLNRKAASELATKGDIQSVRSEIRESELRLRLEIQKSQNAMRNWFVGTAIAIIAALVGAASLIMSRLA